MAESTKKTGVIGSILNLPNDSPTKTIIIAVLMCLVCSILVSTAAVKLKPLQVQNKKNDIRSNIIAVTGLNNQSGTIDELFKNFDVKLVDIKTGEYIDPSKLNPDTYEQRQAAQDPKESFKVPASEDIAKISRQAKVAKIYLLKQNGKIKQIVLPVHGYGLWSTLYGFLALDANFNTIQGLRFYEQQETPGLGGEVDNPKWRALWKGKQAFDEQGNVKIRVVRGHVTPNSVDAKYHVDGLSGATLTSNGVSNLLTYWLGPHGFGPYLKKMRSQKGSS